MSVSTILWQQYRQTGDPAVRERLLLTNIETVKHIVNRMAVKGVPGVDSEDLISYGVIGLIDAVEKFDPSKGVQFETYAHIRVKGEIIDQMRKRDWIPRSLRKKIRELENVYAVVESQLGRSASDSEIAAAAGMNLAEFNELLSRAASANIYSLEDVIGSDDDGDGIQLKDVIADDNSDQPESRFLAREVEDILSHAVDSLPEKERMVVSLYYYDELTIKEIAKLLGVSESRVSQLHTKSILRLRGKLSKIRAVRAI